MKIRSLVHHAALTSTLCLALAVPTLAHSTAVFLVGDGFANGSDSATFLAVGSSPPPAETTVDEGGFTGHIGPNPGPNPPLIPILFWCAELTQTFSFGTVYSTYSISSLTNTLLSQLFTEVGGSGGATSTQTKSAGFQLAVWEILFEGGTYGGFDVTKGNFKVSGDANAIAQANMWLSLANLNASSPASAHLFLLSSPDHQDFITDQQIPSLLVPEPSPLPLLGAGLIALYLVMRRRAR